MVTPVRRQYLDIKNSYPDALVLFRLGDFYEAFDDDARVASRCRLLPGPNLSPRFIDDR